jgi:glycosyltransferase involved in cell wall biosynthesis/SAM-dependent methyltransferase
MRIAILTSSYPRFAGDGTAPFVKSIAETMIKFGHNVEVVAPYDRDIKDFTTNGVKIHRFRYALTKNLHIMGHGRALEADVRLHPLALLMLPFYLLGALITLWRVTGQQKTDVIHVHWVLPNGPVAAFVAKIRRIPFIISLHGSDIFLAHKNRLFGYVAHWVFIQAAAVTACSPELKKRALELGAPESIQLLAWGADPLIFKPADNRKELRQKLGWGDGVVINTLGRMVYKKGFDILLKALPFVLDKHPTTKIIIGGDGPILRELKELAGHLGIAGSVQFMGRVSWNDVPDFLSAANIFVLPSVRDPSGNLDGLPTVLLEAMGCGSAIIASDIGGVSLAIHDKENGLLVKPGSVQELSQALLILLEDLTLCGELGSAARRRVVDDLNWDNVVRKIEQMLYSSISNHSHKLRMGTIYREEMLASLGLFEATKGRVLDVGCYDGFLLGKVKADFRVGIDLHPIRGTSGICLIKADARFLPFRPGCFDKVYALDIIEHIKDDVTFSKSLTSVVADDGTLILTTPSADIRLNPPFLTNWISKKWGHIYRLGYSPSRLMELFNSRFDVKVESWNAPIYRFWYPFLRILQVFSPRLVENWVKVISSLDSKRQEGQSGFQVMVASFKKDQTSLALKRII